MLALSDNVYSFNVAEYQGETEPVRYSAEVGMMITSYNMCKCGERVKSYSWANE